MSVTREQLLLIMPFAKNRVDKFYVYLVSAMAEFEINTPARQAAFLAQIAHESGQLRFVQEIASGSAYEGREDLGNTLPGDGIKYKGRGLIQITGKANYLAAMMALDIDCLNRPELLEIPEYACRSAGWFWKVKNLNPLADAGDFRRITKIINGGYNHFEERQQLWSIAKKTLGA